MDSVTQVVLNVIGGAITVGLIEFGKFAVAKLNLRKFKNIFGNDLFSLDGLHLVYAQLALPPQQNQNGSINTHPYVKPNEERSGIGFSIERPVSSCELRAAKYLSEIIGKEARRSPVLSSDFDLQDRLDISFVAFGGPSSNYKSRDLLTNEGNSLLSFGEQTFITQQTNRPLLSRNPGFDYGLIIKIHPSQFQERIWLICAGYGEWGSSGAAWYLAHKWEEIQKFAKDKPFAIIVQVRPGQDESTEPVIKVKSSEEAENYANQFG